MTFQSLQACRAIAALMVVLHHTNHAIFNLPKYFGHKPLGNLVDFGFAAVDFFFVLSGFIIMHVHARDIGQPRELAGYLWKRFSRVYLFYWVILALVLPVFFLVPDYGFAYHRDPGVIFRSILLIPEPHFHMLLSVAWTMVYEVLFYLLFGLLILDKRVGTVILLGWAAGVMGYSWFDVHPWNFVFSHHHIRFLAGMCVALIVRRWTIPAPRLVAGFGLTLLLGAGMLENFCGPLPGSIQIFCFTASSAIIILGFVQCERAGLVGVPRCLVYFGDAAYAIYLVHFLALSLIAKLSKALLLDHYLPSLLLFVLHVAGAIAIGCLTHHLIEYPLHAWSKRFFRRVKMPAAVPMPAAVQTSGNVDIRRAA